MNKFLWLSTPFMFMFSQSVFSACTSYPQAIYTAPSQVITLLPYSSGQIASSEFGRILSNCNPRVMVNGTFIANSTNSDLTGSSPFGINQSITITGSSANASTLELAKSWLVSNLKLAFYIYDNSSTVAKATQISVLGTSYNILPDTGSGVSINHNGEGYFAGGALGTPSADARIGRLSVNLLNITKPTPEIMSALNGAVVGIRLGNYNYKYANYSVITPPASAFTTGSVQLIQHLRLNFNLPTCTMTNQIVSLAPVPTGILNSNQTGNEQNFNVNINCTGALPNKTLLATITDSFTPTNVNTIGVLKNKPNLTNRSNVDIQLRDANNTPLAIGSQSTFYTIPAGSTETTFTKALKAQYYRSEATATPGFVEAQATVTLDYQ